MTEKVAERRIRASLVCRAEGRLLVVRLRDPVTGFEGLYPPGGGVEPGEAPSDTARRETREETGLDVPLDPSVVVVRHYPFTWGAVDFDVTTHFFGATLLRAEALPSVVDAPYNLGAAWVPVEVALASLAIHEPIHAAVTDVLYLLDAAASPPPL
ncbi:MAG: NUDIX hydrolase [Myxococcales bacterium]|nr:NUDIX hydrolase [Myxococcales bacterium]